MNITTDTTAPARATFTRVAQTKFVKHLVKEARTAGYNVEVNGGGDLEGRDVWGYKVTDPTHDNSLVFKAVLMGRSVWGTTFSKLYFQE